MSLLFIFLPVCVWHALFYLILFICIFLKQTIFTHLFKKNAKKQKEPTHTQPTKTLKTHICWSLRFFLTFLSLSHCFLFKIRKLKLFFTTSPTAVLKTVVLSHFSKRILDVAQGSKVWGSQWGLNSLFSTFSCVTCFFSSIFNLLPNQNLVTFSRIKKKKSLFAHLSDVGFLKYCHCSSKSFEIWHWQYLKSSFVLSFSECN